MIKYTNAAVTLAEVPDEVSLCINLSNCPYCCRGCHSPELQRDIGEVLTETALLRMLKEAEEKNPITCICFMGGDSDLEGLQKLLFFLKSHFSMYKTAWYSGGTKVPKALSKYLDYAKIGPFKKEYGPLNKQSTNQRFYKVTQRPDAKRWQKKTVLEDITHLFWR